MPAAPKEQALNYLKGKRAARLKIKEEKTFQRELFTGHDSGASDVPLQPGSCLRNTPCSFLSVLPCSLPARCRSIQSPYSFYCHSWDVSTDHSLSPPKVALDSHRGCVCGGVYKSRMVEMTFAPRRSLAGTARAAIWQSHQEHFTRLTFTCLHAVNITPSLLWMSSEHSDFQREKWGGERERQCSWETFLCKKEKKEDSHSGMNHTAGRQRPIHVCEIHNIFQKIISGNGYHHVCVHRKLMTFSWQLVALLSGLQYKWSVVMQLGKMAFRFTANELHEFWWFLYIYIQPGAAYTCHDE